MSKREREQGPIDDEQEALIFAFLPALARRAGRFFPSSYLAEIFTEARRAAGAADLRETVGNSGEEEARDEREVVVSLTWGMQSKRTESREGEERSQTRMASSSLSVRELFRFLTDAASRQTARGRESEGHFEREEVQEWKRAGRERKQKGEA